MVPRAMGGGTYAQLGRSSHHHPGNHIISEGGEEGAGEEEEAGGEVDTLMGLAQPSQLDQAPANSDWTQRKVLGALVFLMEVVCYADRTNISLAIVPLADEQGWQDQSTRGFIMSSFFIGYACTQIIGGWLAGRCGGKPILLLAVFVWSLTTLLTPPAARLGLTPLICVRIIMGLAEGVSLPAVHQITACWIPQQERSRFIAFCTSGQYVGTVGAMLCAPMATPELWPWIFYLWGGVGILWCGGWWWLAASHPSEHPRISRAELAYIEANMHTVCDQEQTHTSMRHERACIPWAQWKRFLKSSAFQAIVCAHFSHNWGWYLLLSWIPTYLQMAFGIKLATVGIPAMLPYVAAFLGANFGGLLADWIISYSPEQPGAQGGSGRSWATRRNARRICQAIDFLGGAIGLGLLIVLQRPPTEVAVGLLMVTLACSAAGVSGYWANVLDIGPAFAGPLLGISNTVASLPGVLGRLCPPLLVSAYGVRVDIIGNARIKYVGNFH